MFGMVKGKAEKVNKLELFFSGSKSVEHGMGLELACFLSQFI